MPLSRVPTNVFFGYTGSSTPFSLPATPAGSPLHTPSFDRKNPFDKMFDNHNEAKSDVESAATSPTLSPSSTHGPTLTAVGSGVVPTLSTMRSTDPSKAARILDPRVTTRPNVPPPPSNLHLHLSNLNLVNGGGLGASSQTCVTSDQVNPNKAGYKHWVARSGTLIANLLVTAGKQKNKTKDHGLGNHYSCQC